MEVLSSTSSYFPNSICNLGSTGSWTQQENKIFENALAQVDMQSLEGWEKVAKVTGKSVRDVLERYQRLVMDVNNIEAGVYPFAGYRPASFTLDWEAGFDGMKQAFCVGAKRSAGRLSDQERKKGVPWTEEEHKLFLLGLKKYGKGDWRNISRNYVYSRTPTQVASHAQKYFIRLNSCGKDKRRASIHDITTLNLPEKNPSSPSQTSALTTQSNSTKANGRSDRFPMVSESDRINNGRLMQVPYAPYGIKLESQNSVRGSLHDSMVGHHPMLF